MAIAKRKKRFYDVEVPLINKQLQLQAYEIESLDGRFIKHDMTRLLRGKNNLLLLKVKADKEKAIAHPIGLRLLPSFLKRAVRKGTNYVEDSFSVDCADAQIRIKPFIITRRKVSRVVRTALRNKAKEELIKYVKDKKIEMIFDDILKNQIQKYLSLRLKKIYPLSLCEIRVLKVEKEFEEVKEAPQMHPEPSRSEGKSPEEIFTKDKKVEEKVEKKVEEKPKKVEAKKKSDSKKVEKKEVTEKKTK